jgi:hypothetical protein
MGKLIPFHDPELDAQQAQDLEPPPGDAIASSAWLSKLLRLELYQVLQDVTLTAAERRCEVLRFARAINHAMPMHEQFEVRQMIQDDDAELRDAGLRGEVSRVTQGSPRSLRAPSARRKT